MDKEQTLQKMADEYEALHAEHESPTLTHPEAEPETLPPPPQPEIKRAQPQMSQPAAEAIPTIAEDTERADAVPADHPWRNPMRTFA